MLMLPDWTSPILGWLKAFKGCSLLFSGLAPVPGTCLRLQSPLQVQLQSTLCSQLPQEGSLNTENHGRSRLPS